MRWPSSLWHWVIDQDANWWSAVAGWATVFVAIVASYFAFRQVREARRLREEQAQPYVVSYMEPNALVPFEADLVIRNFGTTAARDVRVSAEPKLQRTKGQEIVDLPFFDVLPILVPGQEWRTIWDSFQSRSNGVLPNRYTVTVAYSDSRGRRLPATTSVLDWSASGSRIFIKTLTVHHAAEALREIRDHMKRWTEGTSSRGLSVYVRDGDARDDHSRRQYQEWKASQVTSPAEVNQQDAVQVVDQAPPDNSQGHDEAKH